MSLIDFSLKVYERPRYPDGLVCLPLMIENQIYYSFVDFTGRGRTTDYPYDNECQRFKNGLSISHFDGRAVFFDEKLDIVKHTEYLLIDHFYSHLAKVCVELPDKKYDRYLEHFEWIGGKCGYIDEKYNVIIPTIYSYQNTPRPKYGKYGKKEPRILATPNPFYEKVAKYLHSQIEGQSPLIDFSSYGGCETSSAYCLERFSLLSEDINEDDFAKSIILELADGTLWNGVVIIDVNGKMKVHKLEVKAR